MNDHELLELAAKAAGITLTPVEIKNFKGYYRLIGYQTDPDQWPRGWFDPLMDDGDALRLAVKLALFESFDFSLKISAACSEDDPYAATRRAIVKAAAEIGKGMK